jgi:hypothetical protein
MVRRYNIKLLVFLMFLVFISCGADENEIHKVSLDKHDEYEIYKMNLEKIDDMVIGSEFPVIVYADEDKVIINGFGIFIYDINKKIVTDSLDIWRFANSITIKNETDIRPWVFSNKDGSELYLSFEDYMNFDDNYAYYFTYSVIDKSILEISRNEYEIKKQDIFECEYTMIKEEIVDKSIGAVAELENGTYIYLNMLDYIVGELEIIVLKEEKETRYWVFK